MKAEEIAALIQDERKRAEVLTALTNEWVPKADFTKVTTAKADEIKQIQEKLAQIEEENKRFIDWYNTKYEPWKNQVLAELETKSASQGNVNPPQRGADGRQNWWDDWEMMTPQQQAQALHQQQSMTLSDTFGKWTKQFADNLDKLLKEREQYYQDYLSLYIDANEKKRQNPELDIQKYMTRALDLKTGKANPLETAYTLETLEKEKEKWLEEGRKHGRQELETELKTKRQETPTLGSTGPEPFKPHITKKEDRMGELKQKVTEKYGPQIWSA